MCKKELILSKALGQLDFNSLQNAVSLYTHWCRMVYAKFEKWNHKQHAHLFWELHLCLGGSMRLEVEGKEQVLTKNTYIFLAPKRKHKILFVAEDYCEFVWGFNVKDNPHVNEKLCNAYKEVRVLKLDKEMRNSVLSILSNTEKAGFGYYHIIKNELYHIFALLAEKAGAENQGIYHKANHNEVGVIENYIRENLQSDISLDDVALFLGMGKRAIVSLLKKEYNKTFSQIKREIRADVIGQLLRETDCTMEEIAETTNFSDRYSMGKFFRKMAGEPPASYRKGIKK